ncbi:MAG: hypothetical protein Q7R39_05790 [Dehalococcoidia bacterium]|nr:hypothetical protein [Dehalococcoidia bacterium]
MGRMLGLVTNELGLELFNQVETAAKLEAIEMAQLMLEERRQRVHAFSERMGVLLGMNPVLDSWLEITSTDPVALLN